MYGESRSSIRYPARTVFHISRCKTTLTRHSLEYTILEKKNCQDCYLGCSIAYRTEDGCETHYRITI
jgi:hypothetical protein